MDPEEPTTPATGKADGRSVFASPACYAILYPALVAVARDHGYALAIHGSMTRDFDLIAVPWVEEATVPLLLILALNSVCGGVFHQSTVEHLIDPAKSPSTKPHGRLSWSLHLTDDGCFGPYLDISVMPLLPSISPAQQT